MKILSIDTSCDETSVAVTEGQKILANKIYSQVLIHKKWGGVVPDLAKRAHEEHIDIVVNEVFKKVEQSKIDAFAVTYGPGLAIALEVGILKAKELSTLYKKPLIAVNHMEGHIYSCFAQNSAGNPKSEFKFPYIALLISGGHTELVLFKDHGIYEILGQTVDDAAGEALDKAAKLIGLGYPGGAVIETLALKGNKTFLKFPRPMKGSKDLNFSFSGLKTSFYYYYRELSDKDKTSQLYDLAASYQEAVFDSILHKLQKAIVQTGVSSLVVGGGVGANKYLRDRIRELAKKHSGSVRFPAYKYLYGDNAAMIGIAAHFKALKGDYVNDLTSLHRVPRLSLS